MKTSLPASLFLLTLLFLSIIALPSSAQVLEELSLEQFLEIKIDVASAGSKNIFITPSNLRKFPRSTGGRPGSYIEEETTTGFSADLLKLSKVR